MFSCDAVMNRRRRKKMAPSAFERQEPSIVCPHVGCVRDGGVGGGAGTGYQSKLQPLTPSVPLSSLTLFDYLGMREDCCLLQLARHDFTAASLFVDMTSHMQTEPVPSSVRRKQPNTFMQVAPPPPPPPPPLQGTCNSHTTRLQPLINHAVFTTTQGAEEKT
ncbi:unnamed protein product [Pleuronectes platessa]|uniref:Uncharacterized protein n=1 Tax=Pleuronectes platessa TaxID=8262 RepID=A0A9N7UCJ6_PLEPL|nr:unnamed protein product [Pleuronectes platessa]